MGQNFYHRTGSRGGLLVLFKAILAPLGKLAKQIFGKSWEFGPTGLTDKKLYPGQTSLHDRPNKVCAGHLGKGSKTELSQLLTISKQLVS